MLIAVQPRMILFEIRDEPLATVSWLVDVQFAIHSRVMKRSNLCFSYFP